MSNNKTAKVSILVTDNGTFNIVGRNAQAAGAALRHVSHGADFADRELKGVAQASSNSTKEFSKMSQGIGGLVHTYAIFAANIFAVSAAFRALSDAADYTRMISGSKQLAVATGKDLLGIARSLKAVSAGSLDMRAALEQTALGSAAGFSGSQLSELVKLATQAGIALGRNVPDAINRLIKAVIKGEPELTDELGIILRLKEATEDYAESIGKTASQLTIGERSQAVYVQALERGQPKYENIEIESQPFDKLASSISEVTTEMLGFVNKALAPFIGKLAESKTLIYAVIAVLGKMLLQKSTDFFNKGKEKDAERYRKRITNINKEVRELGKRQKQLKSFKELGGMQRGVSTGFANPTYGKIGDTIATLDKKDLDKLSKKLRNAIKAGADAPAIGRFFAKSMSDSVRKQLPNAIKAAVEKGEKSIKYKDLYGAERTLTAKSSSDLGKIGNSLRDAEAQEETIKRVNTLFGKQKIQIEKLSLSWKTLKRNMNSSRLLGMNAAATGTWREGLIEVNKRLQQSGVVTKKLGKAFYGVGFIIGKVTKAAAFFGNVLGKAFRVVTVLIGAYHVLNSVFKFDTGNLSAANDLIKDINDSLDRADTTARSINFDVNSIGKYNDELKKMVALGQTYMENIGKAGEIADRLANTTKFELVKEAAFAELKGKVNEFITWYNKKVESKRGSLLNLFFDNPKTIADGMQAGTNFIRIWQELQANFGKNIDSKRVLLVIEKDIANASMTVSKTYADAGGALKKLKDQTLGILNNSIKVEGVTRSNALLVAREVQSQILGMDAKDKSIKLELDLLKIMGLEHELTKARNNNDVARADAILIEIARMGQALGIMNAAAQTTKIFEESATASLATFSASTEKVRDMYDTIKDINAEFGNFAGKKISDRIGDITQNVKSMEERLSSGKLEGSKGKDQRDEISAEIAFLNEQKMYFEKRLEAEKVIAELKIKQKETTLEEFFMRETITQKQIDSKLSQARIDQQTNSAALSLLEQTESVAKRKFKKSSDANKLGDKLGASTLEADRRSLALVKQKIEILRAAGLVIANTIAIVDDMDPGKNIPIEKARDLHDVIKDINKEFGKFAGKKISDRIGDITQRIDEAIQKNLDSGNVGTNSAEIAFLKIQRMHLEKRLEIESKIEKLKLKQKEATLEEFYMQETITQKQIDSKLAQAKMDQLNNNAAMNNLLQEEEVAKRKFALSLAASLTVSKLGAETLESDRRSLDLLQEKIDLLKQAGLIIANTIAIVGDMTPDEDSKGSPKASKGKKPMSAEEMHALYMQAGLETMKQEQIMQQAILDFDINSYKQRAKAAKALYDMEIGIHVQRLRVIRADMMKAEANQSRAANEGDRVKAMLEYEKARSAYVAEVAGSYQKIYDLQIKLHEMDKKAIREDMPNPADFGKLWAQDLIYAADEIRKALVDPITMLTNTIVSAIDTATDSLANAIVENDYSNLREDMSNNLKSSAKGFLSSGFKEIVYGLFPQAEIHGQALDELSALNEQSDLLVEIRDAIKNTDMVNGITDAVTGGDAAGGIKSTITSFIMTFIKGIFGFANGGILNHATAYAGGGLASKPQLAMIGEGKSNEAIVPLPDNRSIPVKLNGNTGSMNSTVNVVVNRDGSSETTTESDARESKRMGELINIVVQKTIMDEQRVGGLLGR